jgi:hypothetical protein
MPPRWLDEAPPGSPLRPDELTRGLLNALDRAPAHSIIPSTLGTVVAGLLTAGLFPAVQLPRMWRRTMRWHQNILWHLAEWMSVNVGSDEGRRLHAFAAVRFPGLLNRAAGLLALIAAAVGVLAVINGTSLPEIWFAVPWEQSTTELAALYVLLISASFILNWLSISLHLRALARARASLDEMTPRLPPTSGLRVAGWEWGLRPVPLVLGVLLAISGMLWALPMLICSTAQRRALLKHHRRLRAQMAHRVRDLVGGRRPVVTLPPVIDRTGMCRNAICDQRLSPDARFCPRCGTPQRPLNQLLE